jgi:hypothetical protein
VGTIQEPNPAKPSVTISKEHNGKEIFVPLRYALHFDYKTFTSFDSSVSEVLLPMMIPVSNTVDVQENIKSC